MIYVLSAPMTHYATTNIEKIYQTLDNFNYFNDIFNDIVISITIYDEESGDAMGHFEIEDNYPAQSFIKSIYNLAKNSKRTDLINWATTEISKYDHSNPTINSLIYSLWQKAERGKDLTALGES